MATEFCQKCKQSHPGRVCDYDDKADCAETIDIAEADTASDATAVRVNKSKDKTQAG